MKWVYVPDLPPPSGDPDIDREWAKLEALRKIAEFLELPAELALRDRHIFKPGSGFPPDLDLPHPGPFPAPGSEPEP